MIRLLTAGIYIVLKIYMLEWLISDNAQLAHNRILLFVAAEKVCGLEQSEATNDSVTVTWNAPDPLNSVVGYAVLVYDSDINMNCRTVTILSCLTCEVCELLTITDWLCDVLWHFLQFCFVSTTNVSSVFNFFKRCKYILLGLVFDMSATTSIP